MRWYIPNGVPLCAGHHTFYDNSAHQNPLWFRRIMIGQRGIKWELDLLTKGALIWNKDIYEIKEYLQ